jgi:hypothetical protein
MNIEGIVHSIDFAPWTYCEYDEVVPQIQKQISASINFNHFDEDYPPHMVSNNMSESVCTIVDEIFDMVQFYCLQYED